MNPEDDVNLAWQSAALKFAQGRLGPRRRGQDMHASADFPELLEEMRSLGFHALCVAERWQGLEQEAQALAAVLAPLCRVDATAGAAVYAHAAAHLALRTGEEKEDGDLAGYLAEHWLAWPAFHDLAEQDWPLLDATMTLSGQVEMLLIGAYAGAAVIPARSPEGMVLVLVDLHAPGVQKSTTVRTLGLSAAGVVDIRFSATPVLRVLSQGQERFRDLQPKLALAALAMLGGVMRGSFETAYVYSQERHQGGGPIKDWGEVRRLLSLMEQQVCVAESLQMHHRQARDVSGLLHALVHVAERAPEVCSDGIQLLGGNGYMKDYGQEKRLRDALQLQCLGGSISWRRQQLAPKH